jgi:hypothetical protein
MSGRGHLNKKMEREALMEWIAPTIKNSRTKNSQGKWPFPQEYTTAGGTTAAPS